MSKISLTLKLLGDGKWHQIDTLRTELNFGENEIQRVITFFEKYDFATVDNGKNRVKVNPGFKKLLVGPAV
jgi:hypothetical protein